MSMLKPLLSGMIAGAGYSCRIAAQGRVLDGDAQVFRGFVADVACRAMSVGGRFFFFFSSRRRHTRFDCDWSSDVCSSDLLLRRRAAADHRTAVPVPGGGVRRHALASVGGALLEEVVGDLTQEPRGRLEIGRASCRERV